MFDKLIENSLILSISHCGSKPRRSYGPNPMSGNTCLSRCIVFQDMTGDQTGSTTSRFIQRVILSYLHKLTMQKVGVRSVQPLSGIYPVPAPNNKEAEELRIECKPTSFNKPTVHRAAVSLKSAESLWQIVQRRTHATLSLHLCHFGALDRTIRRIKMSIQRHHGRLPPVNSAGILHKMRNLRQL